MFDGVSRHLGVGLASLKLAARSYAIERRNTLALVRKVGRERSSEAVRLAGNPGGARAVDDMARDLVAQLRAMHSL